MKNNLNQKLINLIEYYNLINANLFLSHSPIKRSSKKLIDIFKGTKAEKLAQLRKKIQQI